jgi:hypothetical protein
MQSEPAETYLRNLAESELRRYRGDAAEFLPEAMTRVRAVATAFAKTGALDPGAAEGVVEELTTALEVRSPGYRIAPTVAARRRRAQRFRPGAVPLAGALPASAPARAFPGSPRAGAFPVSVTPVGALLELREGETDMVVYLTAAISAPHLASLSAGVLSLPKGSLPRRARQRPDLPPAALGAARMFPGIPGVPRDLRAVDAAGQSYDLVFNGGGDGTWSAGHFALRPSPPGPPGPPTPPGRQQARPPDAGSLIVGNDETSVRIDLTAGSPAAEVTTTENGLTAGEQFLRIRAEAMFASGYHDVGTDLKGLAATVPALRAAGMLPERSELPGTIAALCHRYAVSREDVPDPPAALPDRWASLLTGDQHASWQRDGADSPPASSSHGGLRPPVPPGPPPFPAAAHLPVAFPETDGITTVLSGLVTHGRRSTITGVFFGTVDEGYPEGPCIWLRDNDGQWHAAKQRSWSSGGVNVFWADLIPPVHPSASRADILVIGRTADSRGSVPLTWWTS